MKQNNCRMKSGQKLLQVFCEIRLDIGGKNVIVAQLSQEYS